MAKYIKREDAVFAACQVLDKFGGCKMGALCPDVGCSEVRDIVDQYICKDAVERKRGKWTGNKRHQSCSECHMTYCVPDGQDGELDMTVYHFCPNCGADMREES